VKTPFDSFESGNVAHMKKQQQTEKANAFVKFKNDTLKSNSDRRQETKKAVNNNNNNNNNKF